MRVAIQAKKSAPNTKVAILKETSPGPGATANANIAPSKVINAKIKIQPNMIRFLSRNSLESLFNIANAREFPNGLGTGFMAVLRRRLRRTLSRCRSRCAYSVPGRLAACHQT